MKYKNIEIKWLGHDSFLINFNEKNIFLDPIKIKTSAKADIIFITHSHYDHFSIEDIKKIIKNKTIIVAPKDINSGLNNLKNISPNEKIRIENLNIETIPAYNINKPFHPKSNNWLGYIIDFNGTKVYHSGDSDFIPEMKNIKTNVALLPVSGKYTMDANEAVQVVEAIKPDLAIPMHFGDIIGTMEDALKFVTGCKERGINAVILEKE